MEVRRENASNLITFYRTHRAVMNPCFAFEAIKHCTDVFIENTREILNHWDNERKEGPVDVASWMTRYTIDSLGKTICRYLAN